MSVRDGLWRRDSARTTSQDRAREKRPTFADSQEFLEEAESRLFDLTKKRNRASWVKENFIWMTEQIEADANQS